MPVQVREHLADLPLRFADCWGAPGLYAWAPIPRIVYPELAEEARGCSGGEWILLLFVSVN